MWFRIWVFGMDVVGFETLIGGEHFFQWEQNEVLMMKASIAPFFSSP